MAEQLKLVLHPTTVFVDAPFTLTLSIENPAGGEPIPLSPRGSNEGRIEITLPTAGDGKEQLSTSPITAAQTDSEYYGVGLVSGKWVLNGSQPLPPGGSITVAFQTVDANGETGRAPVTVQRFTSASDPVQTETFEVDKQPQGPGLYAWFSPDVVGLDEPGQLFWVASGADTVIVSGLAYPPTKRTWPLPSKANPPPPPPIAAYVAPGMASQTVSVSIASNTGPMHQYDTTALLSLRPPVIGSFAIDGQSSSITVDADQEVTLSWETQYTTRAFLRDASLQQRLVESSNPAGIAVVPGRQLLAAVVDPAHVPNEVAYVLTALGYVAPGQRDPVQQSITVKVNPVKLLYFKYSERDGANLSGLVFELAPKDWKATFEAGGGSGIPDATLSFLSPGQGTVVHYLGSAHDQAPQIAYLDFTEKDGTITISWVTLFTKSLRLIDPAFAVPEADIPDGTHSFPQGDLKEVTLEATHANGTVVTSLLRLTKAPSLTLRQAPRRMAPPANPSEAPMKQVEIELPLTPAFSTDDLELEPHTVHATLSLGEGQHRYHSGMVEVGRYHGMPVHAALAFDYEYDADEDKVTIHGNDSRTEQQLVITTSVGAQSAMTYDHSPNPRASNLHGNHLWHALVSGHEDLREAMRAVARDCNDTLVRTLVDGHVKAVLQRGTAPVVTPHNASDVRLMYGEEPLPKDVVPDPVELSRLQGVVDSTYVGTVTWAAKTNFANVIGSTLDPKPSGVSSWLGLWRDKCHGGANPTKCSSYNWFSKDKSWKCNDAFVGGHVILGTTAKSMAKGSTVYIFPICSVHNGSDPNYMEMLFNPTGVQLKYW